jgi:hypothetical protein
MVKQIKFCISGGQRLSFQTFLASDAPLPEVENTHVKQMSVNEAIEKGVGLPDMILNSTKIDRDKPGVILWADSEENMDEITIRTEERVYLGRDDSPLETDLPHFATLEWRFTKERAEKLIAYIRKHLKKAFVIEVWNLWIGYEETVPATRKHIVYTDELNVSCFEKLFYSGQNQRDWQEYDCLSVKRK